MEAKLVFRPQDARKLVKMGYRIIDIKPSKKVLNASVYAFEVVDGFLEAFDEIMRENYKEQDEDKANGRNSENRGTSNGHNN